VRLHPLANFPRAVETHLKRDLSLVEIVDAINISPVYFARLFKRAIETSPHQYVIQQRVERAKEMLSQTDLAKLARRLRRSQTLPYK
jgi:transcriptional regulator GlxA family with amidase domain